MKIKKAQLKRVNGLKLNTKFTLVITVFVMIPIVVLGTVLFQTMENNQINESLSYMNYTMERNQENFRTSIDSVNMTTQFFLSDRELLKNLRGALTGEVMTIEEKMDYYDKDIVFLERLVDNNPLLYGVRVYASNDNVQEMMPILYNRSRMMRMDWAKEEKPAGWYFDYADTLFSDSGAENQIVSLVTPITDYGYGTIGIVETAMTMRSMFPALYGTIENEWGCFVTADDSIYFGKNCPSDAKELILGELSGVLEKEEISTYYKKTGKKKQIISYVYIRELNGVLFSVKDITESLTDLWRMRNLSIGVLAGLMLVLISLINYTVKHLLRQFYDILKSIRKVQHGELDVVIKNCGNDEMGELGSQINKMLDHIRGLMEDNIKREILAKNSEIRALQNQINAHFIYNVLESIKMMAEIDEEYAISDAITSLGQLLRYSMRWGSGNVWVEEELEYIRNYLALINLRVDYKIYLSVNVPETIMKQEIPKMSLQPIVENAIYHGIEEVAEDTNIYIKGVFDGDDFIIEVTDAGKGMSEEEVERLRKKIAGEIETSGGSGNGIGLKNVQDRIRMSFGEKYGISIASMQGCFTKVMIRIPYGRAGGQNNIP